MTDTEFRAPSARDLEPTLGKSLDSSSRRRSHISHDSAAASTRSWVIMNQQSPPPPPVEPIPFPDPASTLAAPTPSRPLPEPPRRISVLDSTGSEHMEVEVPSADEVERGMGYQWTTGRGAKAREKGFVGGFVSSLRRLPRAFVRPRRARRGTVGTEQTDVDGSGTEGTGMTGNTLPRYVSNPPTPVVGEANVRFLRPGSLEPRGQRQGQNADDGRRPLHPSFRLDPPIEDVQQAVVTPIVLHPEDGHGEGEGMPGDFPPGPPEDAYEPPLENPYDRDITSSHPISLAAVSPHLSRADDRLTAPLDGDEPVSVHAHPLPSEDYRRMNAADAAHGQARSGTTISSGSFSTESPSFSNELSGFHRFFNALHLLPWVATDRITVDYQPRSKSRTMVSWYHPPPPADVALPRGPPTSSPAAESDRDVHPSHRRHRTHRHTPSPATPPIAHGLPVTYTPYPAFSPPPQPAPPSPPNRRSVSPRRRPHHTQHRHRRRSGTNHAPIPGQWMAPPQTLLPTPPAPVYVIQASPQSTTSGPLAGSPIPPGGQAGSGAGTVGSGSGSKRTSVGSAQLLAPVYMQMHVAPGVSRDHPVAFFPGSPGYAYAYPYAYPSASPVASPAPVQ